MTTPNQEETAGKQEAPVEEKKEVIAAKTTPAAAKASAKKGGLVSAFGRVVGIAVSGSLLTTGIAMYTLGSFSADASITKQTIDLVSAFSASMAVWTPAMMVGAVGYKAGAKSTGNKIAALAAGAGATLIVSALAWPHGAKLYENVHDKLTNAFETKTEEQKPTKTGSLKLPQVKPLALG